jgi:hypothetical protein
MLLQWLLLLRRQGQWQQQQMLRPLLAEPEALTTSTMPHPSLPPATLVRQWVQIWLPYQQHQHQQQLLGPQHQRQQHQRQQQSMMQVC